MSKVVNKKHRVGYAGRLKTVVVSAVSARRQARDHKERNPRLAPTRQQRSAGATPAASEFATFDPADLAPLPSSGIADNLLKESVRAKDLNLSVPFGDNLEINDIVFLSIRDRDGNWVDHEADGVAVTEYDVSVVISFRAAWRPTDGIYRFRYRFHYLNNNNYESGPEQTCIKDTFPPGIPDLSPQGFKFNPTVDALTVDKLEADGSLTTRIYGYSGIEVDDTIYLGINDQETSGYLVRTIPVPPDSIDLSYPKSLLDTINDGKNDFYYRVVDRAGNESARSIVVVVTTLLRSAIDDLDPLDVPAMDNGIVTLDDIRQVDANGVVGLPITIPNHADYVAGKNYSVVLTWGGFRSEPIPIVPTGNDPILYITFPYLVAYQIWSFLVAVGGGSNQTVTDEVNYEVLLDGHVVGIAPPVEIVANFYVPGGVDPDPEDPANPKLHKPELQSDSADTPNNAIPLEDLGKDATVFIDPRSNETPDAQVFEENDRLVIRFRKAETTTPIYTVEHLVTLEEAEGTDPIEATLDGARLAAFGTGAMWLDYEVFRYVDDDSSGDPIENSALSPAQDIPVADSKPLPGDGNTLDEVTWMDPPKDPNIDRKPSDPARPRASSISKFLIIRTGVLATRSPLLWRCSGAWGTHPARARSMVGYS